MQFLLGNDVIWCPSPEVMLLVGAKVDVNVRDQAGRTPLNSLLRFQKNQWGVPAQAERFAGATQQVADYLLAHGANPNLPSYPQFGNISPLAMAAYNGYPQTARFLVDYRANIWAQNHWGKTPLQLCGGGAGQFAIAQMLRSMGGR